ncbi:MAG: hypothetical protein NTW86_26195 [Candidatus Sumerlaeota bacterium]|nr:hypothetical protein [Candidatus Sumerlaeota bacterium]
MIPILPRRRVLVFLSAALLFGISARSAFADGINIDYVVMFGLAIVIPLLLFDVFVEGVVLAWVLKIPYQRTLLFLFVANLLSLLAGIPVLILKETASYRYLPRDLRDFFALYPLFAALSVLAYFSVTVLVESAAGLLWRRIGRYEFSRGRLVRAILLANVATYAIWAPLSYFFTRPSHDIHEFTEDSSWARQPTTKIAFLDRTTGYLQCIDSDGRNPVTLAPARAKDYAISPDLQHVLYRGDDKQLCVYDRSKDQNIQLTEAPWNRRMTQIALSPSGRTAAWVQQIQDSQGARPWVVFFWDVGRNAALPSPYVIHQTVPPEGPTIAWSSDGGAVYVRGKEQFTWVPVNSNGAADAASAEKSDSPPGGICEDYGQVNEDPSRPADLWFGEDRMGFMHFRDRVGSREVRATYGLGSRIEILDNNARVLRFAVDPGWLKFGMVMFRDVALLPNGDECVFDDGHGLYLMDIPGRRIGRIVDGTRFILMREQNTRGRDFREPIPLPLYPRPPLPPGMQAPAEMR